MSHKPAETDKKIIPDVFGDDLRLKATPHNAARADAERKRVLIKAFFRRNTLCIARKNDEIRARFIRQMPQTHCAVLP